MSEFDQYMEKVFSQLEEHATEEHKAEYVTFTYSSKLINNHLDYFEDCMNKELSAYKALMWFQDYLNSPD